MKLMKSLIKRTLGDRSLTFEELTTVVTSAEAVLNSRPLVPMTVSHLSPQDISW